MSVLGGIFQRFRHLHEEPDPDEWMESAEVWLVALRPGVLIRCVTKRAHEEAHWVILARSTLQGWRGDALCHMRQKAAAWVPLPPGRAQEARVCPICAATVAGSARLKKLLAQQEQDLKRISLSLFGGA